MGLVVVGLSAFGYVVVELIVVGLIVVKLVVLFVMFVVCGLGVGHDVRGLVFCDEV